MSDITIEELTAAAGAGDAAAMTALGKRLLVGAGIPPDIAKGVDYISRAADQDFGEALAQAAVFAAAGIGRPASWDQAFDYLRRAADRGWEPARHELRFLSSGGEARAANDTVDLRAWIEPRALEMAFESPRIRITRGLFSPAECRWLIERGRGKLQRARVYSPDASIVTTAMNRSNSEMAFDLGSADVVLILLHARMSATINLPPQLFGFPNLLHYTPGQEFTEHYDFFEFGAESAPGGPRRVQRIATMLIYLNEDFEGGETDFPKIGFRYKGKTGDALMFANVDTAGKPDYQTLHAGLPPTRGEKWLLSQWIYAAPRAAGTQT